VRSGVTESRDVDLHVSGTPQAGSSDHVYTLLRGSYTPSRSMPLEAFLGSWPINDSLAADRFL